MRSDRPITQDEINSTLWSACEIFHGTVELSRYKDWILAMLFLKYTSDVWREASDKSNKTASKVIEQGKNTPKSVRVVVPAGAAFEDLYAKRNMTDLGGEIDAALEAIEKANQEELKGVFSAIRFSGMMDSSNAKRRNEQFRALLEAFNNPLLDMQTSRSGRQWTVGRGFEYLIGQFAISEGKKGGEFYTPPEVADLLVKLVAPKQGESVYDPVCGTGALLVRCANVENDSDINLSGQELNQNTWAIAKLNLLLHGLNNHGICSGDTLTSPQHVQADQLEKFDVVVANPPISLHRWRENQIADDPFNRFWRGTPPKNKADYAFLSHIVESLNKVDGRASVLVSYGVLVRSSVEGSIRKQLVEENLLDAVIALPSNLFFGTSIPVAVMVFSHRKKDRNVLFIEASKEFYREKRSHVLAPSNIERILEAFNERENLDEGFAYLSTPDEIAAQEFNLQPARYVETNPHFLELPSPENHTVLTLSELGDLIGGIGSRVSVETSSESKRGQIPFLRPKNLNKDGQIDYSNAERKTFDKASNRTRGHAMPGDILFTTRGSFGRVGIVPESLKNGAYFDYSLVALRVTNSQVDAQTILRAMRSEATQIEFARFRVGTSQPNIPLSNVGEIRLFIPNEAVAESQALADSLVKRLTDDVIDPLKALNTEFDDVRDSIIDVLESTLRSIRLSHHTLEERVLQKFPLPIAVSYARVLRAKYNPYEQTGRLIELYETISHFLFYLTLAEYIDNPLLQQIRWTGDYKEARKAYKDFALEKRINFIQKVLSFTLKHNRIQLKVSELSEISVTDTLHEIRNYRNSEYHSVSGSAEAQRVTALKLKADLDRVLEDLSFLENYSMCRVNSLFVRDGSIYGRFEYLTGAVIEAAVEEDPLVESSDEQPSIIMADQKHVILLTPNQEWLNLHPFYQVVSSEEFQYESHLCFAKQAKNNRIQAESIQFRIELDLDGYEYLDSLAIATGLKG